MKLDWKDVLWVFFAFLILLLSGFVSGKEEGYKVKNVIFKVDGQGDILLADQEVVKSALYAKMDSLEEKTLGQVNLTEIEYVINELSYVQRAEAYMNRQGYVHIDVLLKEPILRVLPKGARGYYIAQDGSMIEWMSKRTPRVAVATGNLIYGNVTDSLKILALETQNQNLFKMASALVSKSFLHAIVDEIQYHDANHIDLVTNIGEARINVGNTEKLEQKLDKLELFYKEAYPTVGLDSYKEIDLRFEGKIYGKKR